MDLGYVSPFFPGTCTFGTCPPSSEDFPPAGNSGTRTGSTCPLLRAVPLLTADDLVEPLEGSGQLLRRQNGDHLADPQSLSRPAEGPGADGTSQPIATTVASPELPPMVRMASKRAWLYLSCAPSARKWRVIPNCQSLVCRNRITGGSSIHRLPLDVPPKV